jgi:hypothetical protein
LDQQVVRSALKSYRHLFSSIPPSFASLSPSSNYLRFLLTPPALSVSWSIEDFADSNTSILLLELRAALIVQDHAKNLATGDVDASVNQRVSKAVTEAFVAVQVAGMIEGLEDVGIKGNDASVVKKVYLLVGRFKPSVPFVTGFFNFYLVSLDDHRRCTRRSSLLWNYASNSDRRRITLVLDRSDTRCAPCYSAFMSRIDT